MSEKMLFTQFCLNFHNLETCYTHALEGSTGMTYVILNSSFRFTGHKHTSTWQYIYGPLNVRYLLPNITLPSICLVHCPTTTVLRAAVVCKQGCVYHYSRSPPLPHVQILPLLLTQLF